MIPTTSRTTFACALLALLLGGAGTAISAPAAASGTPVSGDAAVAPRRPGAAIPSPPDSEIVALLRRGNLVLLVRHAATDWGQRDAALLDVSDRASQRNLSAIGRAQADSIGLAVRALGLSVGAVLSSPMFRCRDTARIAFGRADTTSHLFVKSPASRSVRVDWLSTPSADGSLLVLVTHQDPYIPLLHLERDQLKEGDVLLVEPLGEGRWRIAAQLTPADWTRLAARFHA